MKILIVSGFLGSGKTTFIKELISRTGKNLVVLENEYGDVSLDSQEIRQNSNTDLKLLEFMEGCVCCTKKDSFSNTVIAISAGLDPEYLIIEPTGIAKLSNLKTAIEKVSYEKIEHQGSVLILNPATFDEYRRDYTDIYEDQIKNASLIVFSKTESCSPELLTETGDKIRGLQPEAEILSVPYKQMPEEFFLGLLDMKSGRKAVTAEESASDAIRQVTFHEAYFDSPASLIVFLEDLLRFSFGLIVRAKGVVEISGEFYRFDVADRQYAITSAEPAETSLVFIGKAPDRDRLASALGIPYWSCNNNKYKSKLPRKY